MLQNNTKSLVVSEIVINLVPYQVILFSLEIPLHKQMFMNESVNFYPQYIDF